MRKALSLVLAAFLVVSAAHAVRAADDMDDADYIVLTTDDLDDVEALDDDDAVYGRFHWGGPGRQGPGPRFMGHGGGHEYRRHGMNGGRMGRHPNGWSGHRGGHGMHGMKGMHRYMDLDLSDAQRKQLVDVLTENYRETLEAQFALMDAQKALGTVYDQDNATEDALVSAHQALGAATGRMAALRRGAHEQVAKILTPEQRERFDAPRGDMRRDKPGRHHRRGGPAVEMKK